jgi:hypothetical protein
MQSMMRWAAKWTAFAGFGSLVILAFAERAYSFDEESDKIVVAVYEFEIRYLQNRPLNEAASFCLMMDGLRVRKRVDGRPLGNGASNEVVAALRGRGYDVYSSNDCAYSGDGLYPRSSSKASIIVGIEPFKFEGNDVPIITSHYQVGSSCEERTLKLIRRNGDYEVIESEMTVIC